MGYTYKGVDCVADESTDEWMALKTASQSGKTAWAYQMTYGYWCLYFGAVLLFLAILRKGWYMYEDWSYRNTKLGKHKERKYGLLSQITALSRSVTYRRIPLIISRITGLPPTLGTLIVLTSSTLFILCVCFIPHFWFRGCRSFGSPPLAVRAGLMCTALTPFLVIISGKTNFISFVTGISYEKLNVIHQSLGWGAFFLAMVHTVPFLVQPVWEGGMGFLHYYWNTEILFRNGTPPLVFLFLLCCLSTRFSRKLCYEVWWHSHWLFGVAYFSTLTWHVFGELEADEYIWGTLGFWAFQILYRMFVKSTFKPNKYAFKSKEARLKLLPGGEFFEVVVPLEGKGELDWMPGQHVFIRFMHGAHTLDNHPFSILTIPEKYQSEIKLIVKPHRGLTKKLYDSLTNDKEAEKKLRCFIDGPYGGMNRDSLAFDKLILVATGTGVTVTAPFLSYIASKSSSVTNCVKKVEFWWVVKSVESVEWIRSELNQALQRSMEFGTTDFDINIFVTNSNEGTEPQIITSKSQLPRIDITSHTESKESLSSPSTSQIDELIKVYPGMKPDIRALITETELLPKTAIICSGTSSLQESCGNAAAALQMKVVKQSELSEVYLHTENFGW